MMRTIIELMTNRAGVSAFSTLAGFDFKGQCVCPVQTHTARVAFVGNETVDLNEVDGLVTATRGLRIGVHTADCLPLLMADVEAGVAAAVHCGWRGTVAGIAGNAARMMIEHGAVPERIVAAFGPHICPECFEVGEEVAAQFPRSAVIEIPGARPHVSLAAAVERELRAAGISRIESAPACSKCDGRFYSVRRQGYGLTARTLTAIMLEEIKE